MSNTTPHNPSHPTPPPPLEQVWACARCGCQFHHHKQIKRDKQNLIAKDPALQQAQQALATAEADALSTAAPPPEPPPPPPPPMQSEEAQAQRSEWLKRFEIAARVHEQPRVLSPIRKLWAVSDLHIEQERTGNGWIPPSLFSEDGLLVARNMPSTNLRAIDDAGKFKHVFYCMATMSCG